MYARKIKYMVEKTISKNYGFNKKWLDFQYLKFYSICVLEKNSKLWQKSKHGSRSISRLFILLYLAEKSFSNSLKKLKTGNLFCRRYMFSKQKNFISIFIFVCPWSPCSAACSIFAIASCFSTCAFSSCRLRSVIKSDSTSSAISKFQSLNFKKFKCLSDRAMIRSLFLQILARLRQILTQSQKPNFKT